MNNNNIILYILVICVVYLLYKVNKTQKESFNDTTSSTGVTTTVTPLPKDITLDDIEKMFDRKIQDLNTERSQVSVTESIKNLGILARRMNQSIDGQSKLFLPSELEVGGDLNILGNLNVKGYGNGIPIGTVIMWTMETPPPPNTVPNAMVEGYEDDGIICWYPCVGGEVNGVKIPDMRGQMIVGQGKTNGDNNDHHDFPTLLSKVGGNVPVRTHSHSVTIGTQQSNQFDDYNFTSFASGDGGGETMKPIQVSTISNADDFHHNFWGRDIIPYSVVVQFWIRIR
jgi:hypothetical protein